MNDFDCDVFLQFIVSYSYIIVLYSYNIVLYSYI